MPIKSLSILIPMALLLAGCSTIQPTATSAKFVVPSLKVKLACGECNVRAHVPSLIQEGYEAEANKAGLSVDTTKTAVLTITSYEARADTARLLAGAFAGKDEIKADVAYEGKLFQVEDYYRNAWLGIGNLAQKIGSLAFEKMRAIHTVEKDS